MVVGFIKESLHDLYMSETFGDVRRMNKRQVYYQFLNFAMIVSSALMVWKGLFVISGTGKKIIRNLEMNNQLIFRIPNRCRFVRINGASFLSWRLTFPLP